MSDYEIWEERYRIKGDKRKEPDAFLKDNWQKLKFGRVLDVACGCGRNACYLAHRGFEAVGVDRSPLAIGHAKKRAADEGIAPQFYVVDLEKLHIPHAPYDSIVITRYLQRDLCPCLVKALKPGGILLYETYTLDYLRYGERTADYLLKPGELKELFSELEILHYEECDKPETREYTARLLARRPLA